jgi:outer membrane protein assembly factor BamA
LKLSPRRVLVGCLALAGVALLLFARGWFPQDTLRGVLERRLRSSLGPGVRIGSVHVVPARLEAVLDDVRIDTQALHAELPRVRIVLGLATLSGSAFAVRSLELHEPRIVVDLSAPAAGSPSAGLRRPLLVEGVRVTGGSLRLEGAALGSPVHLDGIEASGSLGSGALDVSIASGAWERSPSVAIGPVQALLRLSPLASLELDRFDAQLGASSVQASGTLGQLGAIAPHLQFSADADLAEIARLSGAGAIAGRVHASGQIASDTGGLSVAAELEPRAVQLSGVVLDGGRIRVLHARGETTVGPSLELLGGRLSGEAHFTATRTRGELRLAGLDAARLTALVSVGGLPGFPTAVGHPLGGSLDGKVTWTGDPSGAVQLQVRIEASGHAVPLSSLRLEGGAEGTLRLKDRGLDLAWDASFEGAGNPGSSFPELAFAAHGTVRGSAPFHVDGSGQGHATLALPAGSRQVSLETEFHADGAHTTATAQAAILQGSVSLQAEVDGSEARQLRLTGSGLELAQALPGASGQLGFALSGSGPIDRLGLQGTGHVEALRWQQADLGGVGLDLSGDSRAPELRIRVPALGATGQARLSPGRNASVHAQLDLAATPLSPLSPLFGTEVGGSLTGSVELDTPVGEPQRVRAQGRIETAQLEVHGLTLRSERPLSFGYAEGALQLEDLGLVAEGVRLDASGRLGLQATAESSLHVRASADLAQLALPKEWRASGQLRADIVASGTLRKPRLAGTVTSEATSLEAPRLGRIALADAHVDLDGEALLLPGLSASLAGGQLSLAGRVPLASVLPESWRGGARSADQEASVDATWQGLDVAELLTRLRPGSTSVLSGSLAGKARLEGPLRSLDDLHVRLEVPKTSLQAEDVDLEVGPVSIELQHGVAVLPATEIATRGGSASLSATLDLKRRSVLASAKGRLDLRVVSPLLESAALGGTAELDLSTAGSFEHPDVRGSLAVSDGTLRFKDVPQALSGIAANVVFDRGQVRVESGHAELGGGALTLSGSAELEGTTLGAIDFALSGKELALRYPVGLRTRADAELRLSGRPGALQLGGKLVASSGRYDLDLVIKESLRTPAVKSASSPLLRSVALDLGIEIASPIVVRNNLADVRVGGNLSLRGDLDAPEPYGQLDLERDGHVYLQGHSYDVDQGVLLYDGSWDPELDVGVTARLTDPATNADYSVTVSATGNMSNPRLGFDSSPPLSQAEVQNLVARGSSAAGGVEGSAALIGGQAASLLAGQLGRGIGLDQVSVQPQLLSREQTPGVNLTFGKRLTRQVNLAYSLSLNDAENRFIQLSAEPGHNLTGLVQVREDGTYSFGAGQRIEIGGAKHPKSAEHRDRVKLGEVRFAGDPPLPEAQLRQWLGIKRGSKATPWNLQERADALRSRLIDAGYLEAEVVASLQDDVATFRLRAGPHYRWSVEGMSDPPLLDGIFRHASFADEAPDLGRQRLLRELRARGYWRAEVQSRIEDEPAGRALVFTVRSGPLYQGVTTAFPGATLIPESRLLGLAGGAAGIIDSPRAAAAAVKAGYAESRHLAAEVGPARLRDALGRLEIELPVQEGPAATIAAMQVQGSSLSEAETAAVLGLQIGSAYDELAALAAGQRLREHYLELGYARVRILPDAAVVGSDVEISYRVDEGPRLRVGAIEIDGATRTRRGLILKNVDLKPGDPLDPRRLASTERKLRDLALFRRATLSFTDEDPVTLHVTVEEQPLLRAGYQARYNADDGASGEVEAEAPNLAGTGLTLGGRYRRGAEVDERRASLDLPAVLRGRFTVAAFRLFQQTDVGEATGEDLGKNRQTQTGVQLQQTIPFSAHWNLLLGYRYKHILSESPILDTPVEYNIAALDLSVVRETRDNPLDSRRGQFLSFNLELSPKALASDLTFVKGFAQGFFSRSFGPRWSWSQGYRLGLATGFGGQSLISSERFNAGGANSLRGFATDSVGPRDFLGDPVGGQAVVILNQELRLHYPNGLGAAAFYDGGNVFASVHEMSFDLRHVLGAGLRYASPVGLLRLDLGFPLNREPGDKAVRFFFSLGQAF